MSIHVCGMGCHSDFIGASYITEKLTVVMGFTPVSGDSNTVVLSGMLELCK